MKVVLTEDFSYSLTGSATVTAKKGETLEGDPAKWAMAQDKAKRAPEKKKTPPQTKKKAK